jgi:hypothetical protein
LTVFLADKSISIDGNLILSGIHVDKFEGAIFAGRDLILRSATGLWSSSASSLRTAAPALLLLLWERRLWKRIIPARPRIYSPCNWPQCHRSFSHRISNAGS